MFKPLSKNFHTGAKTILDKRFTPLIFSSQRENNDDFQNKVSEVPLGGEGQEVRTMSEVWQFFF